MKQLLEEIAPHVKLYRCTRTGIAWVEDGTTGCGHSCHPSIDPTGSVAGMKKLGYWNKTDRTVRTHGFIYNIDILLADSDEYDEIARKHCQCGANHARYTDIPAAAAQLVASIDHLRRIGVIDIAVKGELVYLKVSRETLSDVSGLSGPDRAYNTISYHWDFAGSADTPFSWPGTHKVGTFKDGNLFYQADIQTLTETY